MTTLKAYTVHDGGDHSVIRFAASNVVARREGASELGIEFNEVDYCSRSREFDAYAPGPVPPLVAIAHGWWFECRRCGCLINEGSEDTPIPAREGLYCSATCEAKDYADERTKAAAVADLVEVFHSRFAGAAIVHAYVTDGALVPSSQFKPNYLREPYSMVTFKFPGGADCARWVFGDEDVTVNPGDIAAWCAWRDKPVLDPLRSLETPGVQP